jgi:uncharacterized protein (UPF0276 family)
MGLLSLIYSLQERGQLAFCEVTLEQLVKPHPAVLSALDTLVNCGVELRLHSVNLLRGQEQETQVHALADLEQWCAPALLSVHAAAGRGTNPYGESFLRPSYDETFESEMVEFLALLQKRTRVPLAIENIAAYDEVVDSAADEVEFLARVAKASGARVVFDVSNHLTTFGKTLPSADFVASVASLPLAHLHVSGGRWLDDQYVDTHVDAIPASHLAFARGVRLLNSAPVLYERDGRFDAEEELAREVQCLLALGSVTMAEAA